MLVVGEERVVVMDWTVSSPCSGVVEMMWTGRYGQGGASQYSGRRKDQVRREGDEE